LRKSQSYLSLEINRIESPVIFFECRVLFYPKKIWANGVV
jgi:hypothetical protein